MSILALEINPIPDIRSTIKFVPNVVTGATGKALFSFYMADKLTVYNIIVEGVTADGVPCKYERKTHVILQKCYAHNRINYLNLHINKCMYHRIKPLLATTILLASFALGASQPSSQNKLEFNNLPQEKIYMQP